MNTKYYTRFFLLLLVVMNNLHTKICAQSIEPQINSDPVYLTEEVFIAGGCFDIANAVTNGGFGAIGTFLNGISSIGIESGIVLSTGSVLNISGPNTQTNYTTNFNNEYVDPDLEAIIANPSIPIRDVAILEFDFTPTADYVNFEYVFASEEYCDFVNTLYNDVFGFFISGPGINGPFSNNAENIALIPGTADFVAINNINHLVNSGFYIDNIPFNDGQLSDCEADYPNVEGIATDAIEFDGFTQLMTAETAVIPCETYHIKLVIGDVTDGQFDSAVFLKANSFEAGQTVVVEAVSPVSGTNLAYEGCGDAYFLFQRYGTDLQEPLTIDLTISPSSTTIAGIDYSSLPGSITFPVGENAYQLPVNFLADGIVEGQESLRIELESACSCYSTFAEFEVLDADPLSCFLNDETVCQGDSVELIPEVQGGVGAYTYLWSTGSMDFKLSKLVDESENISITITDMCDNQVVPTSTITAISTPSATITESVSICDAEIGAHLDIECTGQPPWLISYSFNNELQESVVANESPFQLPVFESGTYELQTISSNDCMGIAEGVAMIDYSNFEANAVVEDITCPGELLGSISVVAQGGSPPYYYEWSNGVENISFQEGLPPGDYNITVTDDNGCSRILNVHLESPVEEFPEIEGPFKLCPGTEVPLTVTGNFEEYYWNNGQAGNETMINQPGEYEVTVVDENGCLVSTSVDIDELEIPDVKILGDTVLCDHDTLHLELNDSFLEILWSDESDHTQLEVTEPGIYSVTVMNEAGCMGSDEIIITENAISPLSITGALSFCEGGQTILHATGMFGSILWSTGWEGDTIIVDQPGPCAITAIDENGCFHSDSVTVIETDEHIPDITGNQGVCPGDTIQLTVLGIYEEFSWTTGETSNSILVDSPGLYGVTVSDGNGCFGEAMIEVEAFDLAEPVILGQSPVCLGDTIVLSIGEEFETYQWTGGNAGSSLEIYEAGLYTVTVEDFNGCLGSDTFLLENFPIVIDTLKENICQGESYFFNDQLFDEAGIYWDTLENVSATGCDSILMLDLEVLPVSIDSFFTQIFEGEAIEFGNELIDQSGIYSDTLLSEVSGCDSIEVLVLEVVPYNAIYDTLDFVICQDDFINFNGQHYNEQGVFNDTIFSQTSSEPDSVFLLNVEITTSSIDTIRMKLCSGDSILVFGNWEFEAGIFRDTLNNVNGCDSIILTELFYSDLQLEIETVENIYCPEVPSGKLEVNPLGGVPPYDIVWNTGDTTGILDQLVAGVYAVNVTDSYGCLAGSAYELEAPMPLFAKEKIEYACDENPMAGLMIDSVSGGTPPYLYALADGHFQIDSFFEVPVNSEQTIIVEDMNGCQLEVTDIKIQDGLHIDFQIESELISIGDTLMIQALPDFEATSISWEASPYLSCLNCATPKAYPEVTTTFSVLMVSENGCEIQADITIYVNQIPNIYIPNVFSPNGDGLNDFFTVFGEECKIIEEIKVFDRWGGLVFWQEHLVPGEGSGWDGTLNGLQLKEGVYVYQLKLKTRQGKVVNFNGDVLLIR